MTKKTVFTSLAFVLLSWNLLLAQTYIGDLVISTQAEADAFSYSEITGSLTIQGDDITDLTALSSLTSVGGNLYIWFNDELTNLDGFSNLSIVGHNFHISYNPLLANVNGLSNLSTVGDDLVISSNPQLTNVDGFSNLSTVGGILYMSDNSTLTGVDGFSNLSAIGNNLWIVNNDELTNVDGLSALTTIGGVLLFEHNQKLMHLNGLSNLSTVGHAVSITNNSNLTNVDGLSNLSTIGNDLRIGHNSKLTSVNGLSNLSTVGNYLKIWDNEQLCNVDGLANLSTVGNDLRIYYNRSLTNVDGLSALTTIGGKLEIENNQALVNLDGLGALTSVNSAEPSLIQDNSRLNRFCGLYFWMSHQHPNINLVISGNANNPTPAAILADGPCFASGIKGRVWFDADRSGTQEPDEPGLASATVQLLDTQGTILCKAATSPAGSYLLKNILSGDYVVQVDPSTLPVQDPELTAGQNPVAVTVHDDQSVFTIDFGFFGSDPNTVVRPQEPLPQDPDLEDNALVFVCGSPTYQSGKDCGWHNAVDGDVEGWDGTTLACGQSDPADPAWAIFQFNTGGIFQFDILAFQTDNGTADDGQKYDYQTRKFEILVSTSGLADSDFTSLGKVTRRFDGRTMEFHKYDHMVQARYIMIRLHSPLLQGGWRQMVEFQPTTFDKRGAMAASQDRPVAALPESMSLNGYPNPFNPATTLSWSLPKDGHASVIVYDLSGAEVARLADGYHASGRYQVTWNAADRPSGVYFVRLYGAGMQKVMRMVLVK